MNESITINLQLPDFRNYLKHSTGYFVDFLQALNSTNSLMMVRILRPSMIYLNY